MKTQNRRHIFGSSLAIFGFLCIMAMASPVSAQQKGCVYLQPGAGYTAKMRIRVGTGNNISYTPWSSSFPIGKSRCQSLDGVVPDGGIFSVQVHANAGKTKTCTPENVTRNASNQTNAVYNAWGTTLSVKCKQPS
jgi:hypothetical protein